jgi:peptidoglycan/xylan/chitin deacetylase (PgdA/CDA1 family)
MMTHQLWKRIRRCYARRAARVLARRQFAINAEKPFISFTFDDFPRSAFQVGGAILKAHELRATYYASLGLMGAQAPTGTMFLREDVESLLEQGHELGCHTFGHLHAGVTPPSLFEESVLRNRAELANLCRNVGFRTFSYPISEPRVRTKQRISRYFACCRGGGQDLNVGVADLNCLSAYFLEQSRGDPKAVKNLIERNRRLNGWLILATHDISDTPTPWGCRPDFFAEIVQCAVQSGAQILPVIEALEALESASARRA